MKQPDPILLLALAVGAAILLLVGRTALTGEPLSEAALGVLGTMLGSLVTAYNTRKKDKKEGSDE